MLDLLLGPYGLPGILPGVLLACGGYYHLGFSQCVHEAESIARGLSNVCNADTTVGKEPVRSPVLGFPYF